MVGCSSVSVSFTAYETTWGLDSTAKTGKKSLFGREATEVKRDRDNKQKLNTEKTEPQTGIY